MLYSQKGVNKCEWQINQARMDRVVCSFGIVRPSARPRQGLSQPLSSTGDSRTREGQIMLSTQEICKCAVLEIAANGKEVVVFSRGEALCSVRRRKKRLRRWREWAPGVEQWRRSLSTSTFVLFWRKRMEIWKCKISFCVFLTDLLGLLAKRHAVLTWSNKMHSTLYYIYMALRSSTI